MQAIPTNSTTFTHGLEVSVGNSIRKVLFVALSSSGQLQIAKYFWEFYKPEGIEASFAVLEGNPVHPFLSKSMEIYGADFCEEIVDSVFVLSTREKDFDCIVSLGNFRSYSTISPFLNTLQVLFGKFVKKLCWDIQDPESLTGGTREKLNQAQSIRDRIEFEVAQFAQALDERVVKN